MTDREHAKVLRELAGWRGHLGVLPQDVKSLEAGAAVFERTWQPIETAPRPTTEDGWHNWTDETWVLVYDPKIGVRSAYASPSFERYPDTNAPAIVSGFEWWAGEAHDSELLSPTHWMPLPDPPKEQP